MLFENPSKPVALILILTLSPILGAVYGVLHDQVTYTISEEYYTKFKFIQFGQMYWESAENIGTEQMPEIKLEHPRLGAATVGVLATWRVGLFIGIILGLFGLIHRNGKEMLSATLKAFAITIGIAAITGLVGLGYGELYLVKDPPSWLRFRNIIEGDRFLIVGSIHNFSYLGGLIGMIAGIVFTIIQKRKYTKGV